jgi:hypothetical protein
MKKYLLAMVGILILNTAPARLVGEFRGWDDLFDNSSDILIARCVSTHNPAKDKWMVIQDGIIPSEIEVISTIKGNARSGVFHLLSEYWPHPGDQFLVFANYRKDDFFSGFQAAESYRIVPLNRFFQTNTLAGMTPKVAIRSILKNRIDDLNEELDKAQSEKKRLEEGINDLK